MEQGTDTWRDARKNKITGSVAGAILGCDPWKSAGDVMRSLVRDHFGLPAEFTGNPATAWGKANEAGAIMDYTLQTGRIVQKTSFFLHENGWLGASPDGTVGNDGLIEVKCPYGIRHQPAPASFKTAKEQPHYYAQMQVEMLCAGTDWIDFFQWTTTDSRLERVTLDKTYLYWAIPELYKFYQKFLEIIADPVACEPYLDEERPVVESENAVELVAAYKQIVEEEAFLKERKEEVLKAIVAMAGEKNCLIGGAKLTRVDREGAISYAKVVKDHLPHLDLSAYRGKPSSFWTLK